MEVATVVVERGIAALRAHAGSVAILDPGGARLSLLRGIGYPAEAMARFQHIPLDAAFPLADAARGGEPIILATEEQRAHRYPHLVDLRRANGAGAMAAIPLRVDGRTVGVLGMNFPPGLPLDAESTDFLLALSQQCALALDRARLYEAERDARREADAANQAKSEFLAVMSHELRTPLNAIAGYAELMHLGVPEPAPPAHQEYLVRIQHAQRHLLALINSVLNFARIEAGHVELSIGPVAVVRLIATVEPLVAPQIKAKQHRLNVDDIASDLIVEADAEKVAQILVNLLANAIKFTPRGGRIGIQAIANAREISIGVRDSGIGIPADRLATIFDPFVQIDKRLTRTSEGVGLGLAISRDLALAMGGDIAVESTPGSGSVFTLTLPRFRPDGATANAASS
jgi:signal transduction histidine kinase